MQITGEQIDRFYEDGYIVLEPYSIFDKQEIDSMLSVFDQNIPRWSDGFVDPKIVDSRVDNRFNYFYHLNDKVKVTGCALRHRITRGHGSINKALDDNFLFGKRVTLVERNFPPEFCHNLENKKLLETLGLLIGHSKISFHNASLAAVYPGCVGESKQLHIDTPGFLSNRNNLLDEKKFLVNAMIYLEDVDENLAPMRVIPGSHKKYKDINNVLSRAFNRIPSKNNITQAGDVWEELLPKGLEEEKAIIGKKGTVVLMNSSLLHAATENRTSDRVRKVLITNYSKFGDGFAKFSYASDPVGCKNIYESFESKILVEETFFRGMKGIGGYETIKSLLVKNKSKPKYFYSKLRKVLGRLLSKILRIGYGSKKYINIGSGSNWRHPLIYAIDYDSSSEISIDLSMLGRLPFENESLHGAYSSHCLEHLKEKAVRHWLGEVCRVLKVGSVFRVTVPDIESYFNAYADNNAAYFDWIRGKGTYRFDSWLRLIVRSFAEPIVDKYSDEELYSLYASLGRRGFIKHFDAEIESITDSSYMLPHTHKSWWDPNKMAGALKEAGFSSVKITEQNKSESKIFSGWEFNKTRPHMSLFVDAIK